MRRFQAALFKLVHMKKKIHTSPTFLKLPIKVPTQCCQYSVLYKLNTGTVLLMLDHIPVP